MSLFAMREFAAAHDCGVRPDDIGVGVFRSRTELGDFVRERREELGLSAETVAASLPVTAETVNQVERGEIFRPPNELLSGFAAALDVTLEALLALIPAERVNDRQTVKMLAHDGAKVLELAIYGDIGPYFWGDGASAQTIRQALADAGPVDEIRVHVNSLGGDVFEAHAILNQLRRHDARVIVTIDGVAASAAATVAMAGDEIRISEGGFLMIHEAWTWTSGDAAEHEQAALLLRGMNAAIARVYANRSGQEHDDVLAMMAATTWMDAERAVSLGFADEVVGAPVVNRAGTNFSRSITDHQARAIRRALNRQGETRPDNAAKGGRKETDMAFKMRVCAALGVAEDTPEEQIVEKVATLRADGSDAGQWRNDATNLRAQNVALIAENEALKKQNATTGCDAEVQRLVNEGRMCPGSDKEKLFRDMYMAGDQAMALRVAATWGDPAVTSGRQSSAADAPGNTVEGQVTPDQALKQLPRHLQVAANSVGVKAWFQSNPRYANEYNVNLNEEKR